MRTAYLLVTVYVVATVVVGLGLGVSTLLGGDSSDYDPVHVERIPVVPDRPADLNATGATDYVLEYEQTRLYNDVIASHNHTIDTDESVLTRCNETSVTETDADRFRVHLRCTGGIDDENQPSQSDVFSYTVTYRLTGTETNQIGIRGYPFSQRDTLETGNSAAQ